MTETQSTVFHAPEALTLKGPRRLLKWEEKEPGEKRIYIAGPMRGIPFYNFAAFDAAANRLVDEGYVVVSPADLDRGRGMDAYEMDFNETDWNICNLPMSMKQLADEIHMNVLACDAMYMLDGWEGSTGARWEHGLATFLELEIQFQPVAKECILDEAARITSGDRQNSYGPPDQDFSRTAGMWNALFGWDTSPRKVAMAMIALKLSRESHQVKRDSWVDMAGYARCGWECVRAAQERGDDPR